MERDITPFISYLSTLLSSFWTADTHIATTCSVSVKCDCNGVRWVLFVGNQ
ncbi:hypothetical protein ZOD2009_15986 [Haladaptatus paucihalophilus DX253]|uniref:Uncharacterized protein n=1 Tax=Haladaptatus paucihalophilus DX253 TaxID=797209 RepID=E7QWK9_HALPU|nr:hypothetical protein ZOD2009_15986 [Haladaptatus paucihalophilus DX253]